MGNHVVDGAPAAYRKRPGSLADVRGTRELGCGLWVFHDLGRQPGYVVWTAGVRVLSSAWADGRYLHDTPHAPVDLNGAGNRRRL